MLLTNNFSVWDHIFIFQRVYRKISLQIRAVWLYDTLYFAPSFVLSTSPQPNAILSIEICLWSRQHFKFDGLSVNLFQYKPLFLRVCSTTILKTLWEKEKIARNEQFLLFPQCFLPFWRTFSHIYQIFNSRLQNLSVWNGLKFVRFGKRFSTRYIGLCIHQTFLSTFLAIVSRFLYS